MPTSPLATARRFAPLVLLPLWLSGCAFEISVEDATTGRIKDEPKKINIRCIRATYNDCFYEAMRLQCDLYAFEETPLPSVRAPQEGVTCLRLLAAIAAV